MASAHAAELDDQQPVPTLDSMPMGIISTICTFVSPIDLVSLQLSCKQCLFAISEHVRFVYVAQATQLSISTAQDTLWEPHVHTWLSTHDAGDLDTEAVRHALGVPSFRQLYHQMQALCAWPVGIWRRIDGSTQWQLKTGGMLVITLQRGVFVAYTHTSQGHVSANPHWAAVLTPAGDLKIVSTAADAQHTQGTVSLQAASQPGRVMLIQRCVGSTIRTTHWWSPGEIPQVRVGRLLLSAHLTKKPRL